MSASIDLHMLSLPIMSISSARCRLVAVGCKLDRPAPTMCQGAGRGFLTTRNNDLTEIGEHVGNV